MCEAPWQGHDHRKQGVHGTFGFTKVSRSLASTEQPTAQHFEGVKITGIQQQGNQSPSQHGYRTALNGPEPGHYGQWNGLSLSL